MSTDEGDDDQVLCRACGQRVTAERATVAVAGAVDHTFVNPAGILFEIVCFATAPGCCAEGEPTTEFSWFPGWAWCHARCGACATHLGWCFVAASGASFWALIRSRLVAA